MTEATKTEKKDKSSKSALGALSAGTLLNFDPDALTLVTDKTHHLYDRRIDLPVDEALVLNIMVNGVIEPVIVTKDAESGKTIVVDGRQRVKAAQEANRRLRKQGLEPIAVPAVSKRGADERMTGFMVSTFLRQDDSHLGRAEKMAKLSDMGKSDEEIAVLFGCSLPTVKNTMSLLSVIPAVRKAVEAGKLGVSAAYKLSKFEPEEQAEKLEEALEAEEGAEGKHGKAQARNKVVSKGPQMRRRKEVEELMKTADDKLVKSVLKWVLGLRKSAPVVGETEEEGDEE